jgi:hypothetical protein
MKIFRGASPLGPECGSPLLRPLAEADLRLPGQAALVLARPPGVGARAQRQQVGYLPLRLLRTSQPKKAGISIAEPDPNPEDPYVFGPPGSASGSILLSSSKIVRKTLIPTVL